METAKLNIQLRERSGKSAAKSLRKLGLIPAVLYGHNTENILAAVSAKNLNSLPKTGKVILFSIESDSEKLNGKKAFIKKITKNPIKDNILHIDFYVVPEKEKVKLEIPIKLTGKPIGVTKGGILEQEKREITVKALPDHVPDYIVIDVTNLEIGHTIHAYDIKLPEGVFLSGDPNVPIVTVVPPKVEVELTPEEKAAQLEASLAKKVETKE